MTSVPATTRDYEASPDDVVPLRHGLTAVVVRYAEGEERPQRTKLLTPAARNAQAQQESYDRWWSRESSRWARSGGGAA